MNCSSSGLYQYLSSDGIIYLPHFKTVLDNLTPNIRDLYDIIVVTNKFENPLIKAGLDFHKDLEYFNNLYIIEREVDGCKGYCFALKKKSNSSALAIQRIEAYIKESKSTTETFVVEWFKTYCEVGLDEVKVRLLRLSNHEDTELRGRKRLMTRLRLRS